MANAFTNLIGSKLTSDHPGPVAPGSLVQPTPPLDGQRYLVSLPVDSTTSSQTVFPNPQDTTLFANMAKYRRALNFLSASMIFLKDSPLKESGITQDDVKERLLGHWGTCPAIGLVYSHCNRLIIKNDINMFLVVGPGHGAPAILSALYLEGALGDFYSDYTWTPQGLKNVVKHFSWPGGFPSHINAATPGTIHEGGELGYALAVSFGAVMDNPDLIVTCIVGDGEAESGPTATAWHSYKYLDPVQSGAVLPILNANGYKISEPTIFGSMSDEELGVLFSGYGYQVRIVRHMDRIDEDFASSLDWAYSEIRRIQGAARGGKPIPKARWPLLILRTPKGWTGPSELDGKQVEGTFRSHQVPLPKAKKDNNEFKLLKDWLDSYNGSELFDNGKPIQAIMDAIPSLDRRMGRNKHTYSTYKPLDLPDIQEFASKPSSGAEDWQSCMNNLGSYLAAVIEKNPSDFRIFSPDELESNKLGKTLEITKRNFQWDPFSQGGGRVIEVLSEHNCQGWMQGYTLTGRTALFPSYESFLGIITTMMLQYAKFQKIAFETSWRKDVASINYIQSSTLWRQEHNGYSHQNPGFIDSIINLKTSMARIYLPADANTVICTVDHCLASRNYVNLVISSKQPMPVWLSMEEAVEHCRAGASIWRWASIDDGVNPHVVLVGCGNEVTFEVLAAAALLRRDCPELRLRVVNITDLMILSASGGHPHALSNEGFEALFTKDKDIIINFHGYPGVIRGLIFDRKVSGRLLVHGYDEEGTTTTPFKMLTSNGCSRFDLAIDAIKSASRRGVEFRHVDAHILLTRYESELRRHDKYIADFGTDPAHLMDMPQLSRS